MGKYWLLIFISEKGFESMIPLYPLTKDLSDNNDIFLGEKWVPKKF